MRVGIGLPNGLPGATGQLILEWARQADQGPFSSLGVVDRLTYDSHDPLVSLAAAAGVTRHITLVSMIVVGPLYSAAMLAKVAASLDALSNSRLVLGLAIGARKEDYDTAGIDYHSRATLLNEQLSSLRTLWEDGQIVPNALRPRGPDLLVGGSSNSVFARVARYADGYVHGGGPPRTFARAADRVRAAWSDMRRPGKPQLWAQSYFALGDDTAIKTGHDYMKDYYAFTGPFAERIAAGLLTTPQAIAQFMRGYEEAGCDEMVLFPTIPDIAQLEQLAHVLEGLPRRHDSSQKAFS